MIFPHKRTTNFDHDLFHEYDRIVFDQVLFCCHGFSMEKHLKILVLMMTELISSVLVTPVHTRTQLFDLVEVSKTIQTSAIFSVQWATSTSHCAIECISSDDCKSFSIQSLNQSQHACQLSKTANPPLVVKNNSNVFKISSRHNVVAVETTTTTGVLSTTSGSAACTDPSVTYQPFNCDSTPTFSATGIIKLGSNRALVFMTNNKYLRCSSISQVADQGAKHCDGPYNIVADEGLDRYSNKYTSGPPTAGVGYIRGNMADSRYFLFKGDKVYCYQHTDDSSYKPWMKTCSGWTSMNIQTRFGTGIPSDPDDVIGNFDNSYDFYFLKDNQVYKSRGNSSVGTLSSGFPKPVHDVFPNLLCHVTAATEGEAASEYYSVVNNRVYKGSGGTVYDKYKLCHTT